MAAVFDDDAARLFVRIIDLRYRISAISLLLIAGANVRQLFYHWPAHKYSSQRSPVPYTVMGCLLFCYLPLQPTVDISEIVMCICLHQELFVVVDAVRERQAQLAS